MNLDALGARFSRWGDRPEYLSEGVLAVMGAGSSSYLPWLSQVDRQ
ncbi:hypothetical protein [Microcoleus sp. D3_18a_C4]